MSFSLDIDMTNLSINDKTQSIFLSTATLHQHPEAKQLEMLADEACVIRLSGVQPSTMWFQSRMHKIFEYSGLNWAELTQRYMISDPLLSQKANNIQQGIAYLIQDWSTQPLFDFSVYHIVITNMNELWKYYETQYMDENYDIDVSDLISGMKHL
jgi:hypothetical protein